VDFQPLIAPVLALQFAAFGWRIIREINVADQGRRTWFPLYDYINILALICVALFCIVIPLAENGLSQISKTVLAVAYILIALHPINAAAHYRLFSREGRHMYERQERDYPYITDQEIVTTIATLVFAVVGGWYVYTS
jgi:hypothetical protein